MDLGLFTKIASFLKGKTKLISLHVLGDPLVLKPLLLNEYLSIAKANSLKVDLVTSGFFLDEDYFKILSTPPIHQVSFSLESYFFNRHKTPKYFEVIKHFCAYKLECKSEVFINLRLFSDSLEVDSITKDFASFFECLGYIDKVKKTSHGLRLAPKVILKTHNRFKWNAKSASLESKIKRSTKCLGGIKQLAFLSNGKIVPCCMCANSEISFGDASLDSNNGLSLETFLESRKFLDFTSAMRKGEFIENFCKTCSFKGIA
ncbi:radical SAM protein [Helicobacter sp. 11S02629-2]|uniref:SPASM domain-containing protein n=1 Tax=Helicobacter sp. 11S02629-2 TaxID=1476195 RepID=UPI00117B0CDA|nr:radical SAM protein [Helicobacter sp. 11S02629-2]